MKKLSHAFALLFVAAILLSSCSMLTKSGRQQRAYEHYVRKSSMGRVKQQRRFASGKPQMPVMRASEPTIMTNVSGPQSVSDGSDPGISQ